MLVLLRKENQTIKIGENIRILIVEVDANRVKIGIDAPKDVKILRDDVKCKCSGECGSCGCGGTCKGQCSGNCGADCCGRCGDHG